MTGNRWWRVLAPFAAGIVTVALMALAAGAHHSDVVDPNDTRGKLDVRQVRFGHTSGPPFWTIITFGPWQTAEMWDNGYLMVLLDTKNGVAPEHYLLIRSIRTKLEGSLWRIRAVGPDSYLGPATVRRLSSRSASVQVRLHRLAFGERRAFYRWSVQTVFTGDVCQRTCQDRAPNRDPVLQWRPGMSPTPSPSPSPSPPPSVSPSP